ncbi:4'-phosphopantetheinyl transferase superfamily protein [Flavobacterium aquidurense]|uniref:Phosphopantetheinyl transferase (Holo-ACP synthase) n=1 Tax=Flavobacterium aquidurense TaxID=362413 RepID=A0A0Q0S723_9FLAO|nr:4'-phosphopantetheinyl transferase superfamily protein [Flavobacterium aquidurense]KQB41400.1 Phosphopantetheinyl transferase (Holo-ACP synthase) [Flavobacterium aquidurense]
MIGNDVIDIIQSRQESNWQRKGFIEKLFAPAEQLIIAQNPNPEIIIWLLWSMKEAAYKIYNRETKIREYIPKKLVCTIASITDDYSTGQVICGETIYHTKTTITPNSLHTIAVTFVEDLNNVIEIEKKDILKDEDGIPYLSSSSLHNTKDVSISHHGRFEKVVIIKKNKDKRSV